jgi:hypothetical protein
MLKIEKRRIGAAARGELFSFRILNSEDVSELRVFGMDLYTKKKHLRRTITG